jgi:hypothetical protein
VQAPTYNANGTPGCVPGSSPYCIDIVGPSLAKQTDLTERLRMKVGADFFNAFNHLNFLTPSTSLYSPTSFGVVTVYNSANAGQNVGLGPRRVQVSLRVEF